MYRYAHFRYSRNGSLTLRKHDVMPKGGYTIAILYDNNGDLMSIGVSKCNLIDTYNKRLGRTIAMERAESVSGKPVIPIVCASKVPTTVYRYIQKIAQDREVLLDTVCEGESRTPGT
jgi:hypothetical protein